MKKFALIVSLFSLPLFGQVIITENAPKKNIVKSNLTGLIFRNFQLTYERAITRRFSVNATFATLPKGGVPIIKNYLDADDDFGTTQIGQTSFTLEPRFYLGKGWGKGFYLAPYYRYSKLKVDELVYNFENTFNEDIGIAYDNIPVTFSGDISSHNFGFMIGTQWLLGSNENWVIDFWILGAHYGNASGTLGGKSNITLSQSQQAELQQDIIDLDIPVIKYTVKANANGADAIVDGPWLGLRAGLSFGYRF